MRSHARFLTHPVKRQVGVIRLGGRWQSTEAAEARSTSSAYPMDGPAQSTMERAAAARREVYNLWRTVCEKEEALSSISTAESGAAKQDAIDSERVAAVGQILETYKLDPTAPREEDVSRGIGDALDRLLLLCVPLAPSTGTEQLEQVLHVAGRQGRKLSVRSVQHLFSRTSSYAEALAVFYALRRCHFAMNMEAYHAMLYSLQRLEEEGWAMRFHDEYVQTSTVSEQALDFVLRGVDSPLMPENKPWLGRMMFADSQNDADHRQTRKSFDAMGQLWTERYKNGGVPRL